MKKIKVDLGDRSYDISIGEGAVNMLPSVIKGMRFTGPVVVITDRTVLSKTAKIVDPVLKELNNDIIRIAVPATERSKSLDVFRDTIERISKKTKTHRPVIVALGGGVVGDLAGFVASAYRRGVPLIQVPTTLLAQVDSSIGGKVGIDLPEAKNLVGAFYQPACVLADTRFLDTLPRRQIRNGLAEVIKYGIISNKKLFNLIDNNMEDILLLKKKILQRIIYECASIKARIVEKDERDVKDIRIVLNFGHTLGHAIEAASGYSGGYNHGESIAVGMMLAGEIALRLDMFTTEDLLRIKKLIHKAGLPASVRGVSLKQMVESYRYDKKFVAGTNRLVLPAGIGKVEVIEDIPWLLIKTVLNDYVG